MNKTEKSMHVKVVESSIDWPYLFEKEAQLLQKILKDNLVNIFHIGSTSVPGLKAKPIIDIMPVVLSLAKVDACNSQFEALGYEPMGEFGISGRRYFRKGGKNRTHQIHIFQYENLYDIIRHLAFRDYLRSHKQVKEEYAKIKETLALRYPYNIEKYCDGKNDFVKQTENKALQWYLGQMKK